MMPLPILDELLLLEIVDT